MDQETLFSIGLVLVFVLVGGVFAGTEIALVSLRESQIDQLARRGGRGARVARVARDPNRFLAAVQIGVTVAGFLSAAYGAATLAPDFAPGLERVGLSPAAAQSLALILLTLLIAYLSLVLGELVPKRLALQKAAQVSLVVAPALDRFASVMRPVIWFLSASTDVVVRLIGGDPRARSEEMSPEELRELVSAHRGLPEDERRILHDVFAATDRTLAEVMRPRGEVAFVPADLPVGDAVALARRQPYSRYPVTGQDVDDVLGYLHVRDLLDAAPTATVSDLRREILYLPSTNSVLPTLATMRRRGVHIAVVVDEYGGTDGIVTLEDLVEELVGEIRDEHDAPGAPPSVVEHGTHRLDAAMTIEEFADRTGTSLPDGPYETVAGFVLSRLGRMAAVGDVVPVADGELVVAATDGRRIRQVDLVRPASDAGPGAPDGA